MEAPKQPEGENHVTQIKDRKNANEVKKEVYLQADSLLV
jgi:hypothetical protein